MRHLSIDIETFSSVDLKNSGLYKYVQSPDFQILLFAYSMDKEAVRVVDLAQGEVLPIEIIEALKDPFVIKHAYNATFEWYALNKFYYSPLEQWRCTMLHGLYCGLTSGLGNTAKALGLPEDKRKLSTGSSLIKTFCTPVKPAAKNGNITRILPHMEVEKWNQFKEYCRQDVAVELEVERRLAAFPVLEAEQKLWEMDQRINAYGVKVDLPLIEGALYCSDRINEELTQEAIKLSGLKNPNSLKQLALWLKEETGEEISGLRKDTVKELLEAAGSDTVKRMLELRQELSKTSVKKYAAMASAVCVDGRIRGLLIFYGANRTGRWTGRLVQVQNLPKNYLEPLHHARQCVKEKKLEALKLVYGNVPDTLSQLTRTAFVPSDNHIFLVADFSAIEARIIAYLAEEQWRLQVFETHGKIYEASAAQMFGVPIESIVKGSPEYELRQKGKIAELALGYQGAAGALIAMGALKLGLSEEELSDIVKRWRASNKKIVKLWEDIENAALKVMRTGQKIKIKGLTLAREADFDRGQDFLTIELLSGRKLFYAKPFLHPDKLGKEAVHYGGIKQGSKKWEKISTYGGKLTENIVQAIARDCLAESLKRLEEAGYQIIMSIHDEVVLEVPKDKADLKAVIDLMEGPIEWATGLKLRAEGYEAEFYRKN